MPRKATLESHSPFFMHTVNALLREAPDHTEFVRGYLLQQPVSEELARLRWYSVRSELLKAFRPSAEVKILRLEDACWLGYKPEP